MITKTFENLITKESGCDSFERRFIQIPFTVPFPHFPMYGSLRLVQWTPVQNAGTGFFFSVTMLPRRHHKLDSPRFTCIAGHHSSTLIQIYETTYLFLPFFVYFAIILHFKTFEARPTVLFYFFFFKEKGKKRSIFFIRNQSSTAGAAVRDRRSAGVLRWRGWRISR